MSLLLEAIAAVIGTIAFSLLFGVPTRFYPYCGLIGGSGWIVYAALLKWVTTPVAALVATIVVILLSRMFAVRKRCPVTIFLISGIFPLVPGAGVYWTAYYIVTDELALAARTGFMALKVAVAIVLGIVFVFELPQGFFKFAARKPLLTDERKERENKK
jgi:uncharacterized membrane protein YjjB (DUF3815 family)